VEAGVPRATLAEVVKELRSIHRDMVSAFEEALQTLKLRLQNTAFKLDRLASLIEQPSMSGEVLESAVTYSESRAARLIMEYCTGPFRLLTGEEEGEEEEARRRALVYACAVVLADFLRRPFTVQQLAVTVAWVCANTRYPPLKPTDEALQLLAEVPLWRALEVVEREKKLNVATELFKENGYFQLRDEVKTLYRMGLMSKKTKKESKNIGDKKRLKEYLYYPAE